MKRFLASLIVAAALCIGLSAPAFAASQYMCAPGRDGVAGGPGRWTAPTSGTIYGLNARGCAVIGSADIGDATAANFIVWAPYQSVVRTGVTSSASNNSVVIPAGAFIQDIIVQETSGSAVTGGVKIGSTNGGTDVVSVLQMPASTVTMTSGTTLLKKVFSSTAPTTLYVDAVGNYNLINSSINFTVVYGFF